MYPLDSIDNPINNMDCPISNDDIHLPTLNKGKYLSVLVDNDP